MSSRDFESVADVFPPEQIDLFATRDEAASLSAPGGRPPGRFSGVLTFERLFSSTQFVPTMRELCRTLQQAYQCPVDIEFTAHFATQGQFRINLLQCRPFQVKIGGEGSLVKMPDRIDSDRIILQSHGPVVGHSVVTTIDRLIYVVPSVYSKLGMSQRYSVARTIGRVTHLEPGVRRTIMLVGPGRWGTTMPSLGVPVSFAEINTVSVICELAVMHSGLIPDVSLGTHFFNDLVEMDMLYLAVSPGHEGHALNEASLGRQLNQLATLVPSAEELSETLWVIDSDANLPAGPILLNVDSMKQSGVCYWEHGCVQGPNAPLEL